MEQAREFFVLAALVLAVRLFCDLVSQDRFPMFRLYLLLVILATLGGVFDGLERVASIILVPVKIAVTIEALNALYPRKDGSFFQIALISLPIAIIAAIAVVCLPMQKGILEPHIVQFKHAAQASLAVFIAPLALYSCRVEQEMTAWRHGVLVTALWWLYGIVGLLIPITMRQWLACTTAFWWIFLMLMVAWIYGMRPYRQTTTKADHLVEGSPSEGGSGGFLGGSSSASCGNGSGMIGFLSGFPMPGLSHEILTKSDRSVEV